MKLWEYQYHIKWILAYFLFSCFTWSVCWFQLILSWLYLLYFKIQFEQVSMNMSSNAFYHFLFCIQFCIPMIYFFYCIRLGALYIDKYMIQLCSFSGTCFILFVHFTFNTQILSFAQEIPQLRVFGSWSKYNYITFTVP